MESPHLAVANPEDTTATAPPADAASAGMAPSEGKSTNASAPVFFLTIQRAVGSPIEIEQIDDRDALVARLREIVMNAATSKYGQDSIMHAFEGRRVRITGSPIRMVTFPDLTQLPLMTQDSESDEDGYILPRLLRGAAASPPRN